LSTIRPVGLLTLVTISSSTSSTSPHPPHPPASPRNLLAYLSKEDCGRDRKGPALVTPMRSNLSRTAVEHKRGVNPQCQASYIATSNDACARVRVRNMLRLAELPLIPDRPARLGYPRQVLPIGWKAACSVLLELLISSLKGPMRRETTTRVPSPPRPTPVCLSLHMKSAARTRRDAKSPPLRSTLRLSAVPSASARKVWRSRDENSRAETILLYRCTKGAQKLRTKTKNKFAPSATCNYPRRPPHTSIPTAENEGDVPCDILP
jgi:hypothetical protein